MPYSLQEIADKVQARLKQATQPSASFDILTLIGDLVVVLQAGTGPDPRDATIASLQSRVAELDLLANQTNDILQQLKIILEVPEDRTMTALPEAAQKLVDQLKTQL